VKGLKKIATYGRQFKLNLTETQRQIEVSRWLAGEAKCGLSVKPFMLMFYISTGLICLGIKLIFVTAIVCLFSEQIENILSRRLRNSLPTLKVRWHLKTVDEGEEDFKPDNTRPLKHV